MGGFFNPERGIWPWMGIVVDVFGLSILWFFLCIPVVTVVPATAALYHAVVRCVRARQNGAFGCYLRSFRENLKTGLWTGLIAVPAAALLFFFHAVVRWYGVQMGGVAYVLYVAYYVILVLPVGLLCWLCPLLGRFDFPVRGLFRTAFQLTFAHLPSTAAMAVLTAWTAALCVNWLYPVMFLPAAVMLLVSLLTERIFRKYSPELAPEEPEE